MILVGVKMRSILISSIFVVLLIIITLYNSHFKAIETLTYFPKDQFDTFIKSYTDLQLQQNNDLIWTTYSETEEQPYLRQDISLLYENGQFKGAVNLWKEGEQKLSQQKRIPHNGNKLYESISFHHSEIHRNENIITGNQQMSSTILYVYTLDNVTYYPFEKTQNKLEKEIKHKLQNKKKSHLNIVWNELIDHFNIDQTNYFSIPLIDLIKYKEKPLPTLSQAETDRVIGQLWEGLYKNYIIPLTHNVNDPIPHLMPLILLDKNGTHLFVLFEIRGEKTMLKQLI